MPDHDQLLQWAQRLQALSQTGLTFAVNDFDRDRYGQIGAIAAEMMAAQGMGEFDSLQKLFAQQQGSDQVAGNNEKNVDSHEASVNREAGVVGNDCGDGDGPQAVNLPAIRDRAHSIRRLGIGRSPAQF